MRGQAFPIPIPTGGVDYSHPPHLLAPNQLSDGQNVYLDIDGLYKPRHGYTPLLTPGPSVRIQGGINYQNSDLTYSTVVAGLNTWWSYDGATWTNITDLANPWGGIEDDPARFTAFSQSGVWYACGVNNSNKVTTWTAGDATYTIQTSAPVARDILVLGSRLVCFNTVESGTRYPRRARWSAFEDRTSWPTLNFNDMLDDSGFIVGARNMGALAAAVYGSESIWILQSNPSGNDASAFTAQSLFTADGYAGPISSAAIVVAEGGHYYLGTNGHIYFFNGVNPTDISGPICPKIIQTINFATGTRCHGIYLPMKRALVFFFPQGATGSDCQTAAYFDLTRGVWEPLFQFSEPITTSFQGTYVTGQTWANDTFQWATSPYTWQSVPRGSQLASFIGTDAGQVHAFFQAFTDAGLPIAYSAYGPLFSPDPSKNVAIDRAEFYCYQPAVEEFLTFQFDGFGAPYQPATPIVSYGVDISTDGWTNMMTLPGPTNPNNMYTNFLRLAVISSQSNGGFAFAGGVIYLCLDEKGDYSVTAISS